MIRLLGLGNRWKSRNIRDYSRLRIWKILECFTCKKKKNGDTDILGPSCDSDHGLMECINPHALVTFSLHYV